tara:strand:- start:1221 stop:1742 length:522 start_codon:yes stop_codon:yes gene_type:complete
MGHLVYLLAPTAISEFCEGVKEEVRENVVSLDRIDKIHCTLAYGDIKERDMDGAMGLLDRISIEDVGLDVAGLGIFPGRDGGRYLVARVHKNEGLLGLQGAVFGILGKYGSCRSSYYLRPGVYDPHVTIARVDNGLEELPSLEVVPAAKEVSEFYLAETNDHLWRVIKKFSLK